MGEFINGKLFYIFGITGTIGHYFIGLFGLCGGEQRDEQKKSEEDFFHGVEDRDFWRSGHWIERDYQPEPACPVGRRIKKRNVYYPGSQQNIYLVAQFLLNFLILLYYLCSN